MTTPVKGRISSKFGPRIHPVTREQSFHSGVDIAVPVGTPVVAPVDGTVVEVWATARGGKQLAMTGEGYRFGFAHLSVQRGKRGQKVKAGEVIALSGNTGASTGPHVHFSVRQNNAFIDPETLFKF